MYIVFGLSSQIFKSKLWELEAQYLNQLAAQEFARFNTEKTEHGAVLRELWESVSVQKNEFRNQDFNLKFSNLLNQGS